MKYGWHECKRGEVHFNQNDFNIALVLGQTSEYDEMLKLKTREKENELWPDAIEWKPHAVGNEKEEVPNKQTKEKDVKVEEKKIDGAGNVHIESARNTWKIAKEKNKAKNKHGTESEEAKNTRANRYELFKNKSE